MENQKSIKNTSLKLSGVGLHTGATVSCTFVPAPANAGIVFKRIDLAEQTIIPADVDFVVSTNRGTSLSKDNAVVHTVEHVMAALAGLQIDNVIVEIEGPEVPILDGSALPFVEALKAAEIVELEAARNYFNISDYISYKTEDGKSEIIAIPDEQFKASVMIDFESKVLVTQSAYFNDFETFDSKISKARTFVFLHELEFLIQNNLIKGGDVNNAIVFVEDPLSTEKAEALAKLFNKPEVKVNGSNTLNNVELHYANEPARHKLLDLMGDLMLIGMPIKGNVIATRPGHTSNIEFAKKIKQLIKLEKAGKTMPHVDTTKVLYDVNQIADFLPHRYPFLLVDKILDLNDTSVIGLKNVTMNEPFFQGHFPGNPVMPGVLQIEAMAQVGGILAMNSVDDYKLYTPYFIKIESVKFKQKVVPGDTLIFIVELVSPIRRGICHMAGKAYVDGKVAMEAEMMAQLVKKAE